MRLVRPGIVLFHRRLASTWIAAGSPSLGRAHAGDANSQKERQISDFLSQNFGPLFSEVGKWYKNFKSGTLVGAWPPAMYHFQKSCTIFPCMIFFT